MANKSLVVPTLGYNHLEIGAPGNAQTFRVCGGETRGEDAKYPQCQRPAGLGTDHVGVGRCYHHGGSSRMKPNRYSKLWRGRMKEIAEAHLEADQADPLDLLAELEVQRVLLSVMIDRLQGVDPPAVVQGESPAAAAIREQILAKPRLSRSMKRKMEMELDNNTVVGGGDGQIMDGMVPMDSPLAEFSTSRDVTPQPFHGTLVLPREGSVVPGEGEAWDKIQELLRDITTTVTRITAMRNQTAITRGEITWIVMMMKEGMDKFVPKENQEAYVQWIMDNIPGMRRKDGKEEEEESA